MIILTTKIFCNTHTWLCIDFESATTDDYNYLYECLDTLKFQGISALHNMDNVQVRIHYGKLTLQSTECSLVFEITDQYALFINGIL